MKIFLSSKAAADIALVLGVSYILYFYDLRYTPFFDKQEPREALVVREIVQSGNWILPLRDGNEIPSKPPLFHWFGALTSEVTRELDEFTVRFPSAFFATAGVLLVFFTAARNWGRGEALLASMVLATNYEWRQAAKAARVDMTLTFILLCAFLYFHHAYHSEWRKKSSLILGCLLGLAVLAKGPLGFAVPVIAYLSFLWAKGDLSAVKRMHPFILVITCFVIAVSWYALALWQGGWDFLDIVIKENFTMVVGAQAGHPHAFYWYVQAFFQNAAPWSLFLIPIAIWLMRSGRQSGRDDYLFYLIWFGTVFIFFSAFTQKRSVYILSLYPAFAMLFAAWYAELKKSTSEKSDLLAKPIAYLNAATFILFSAVLLSLMINPDLIKIISSRLYRKDEAQLLVLGQLIAQHGGLVFIWTIICGVGGILLTRFLRRNAWGANFAGTATMMVFSFAVMQQFDNDIAQHYSFKRFTEQVVATIKNDRLYFFRTNDYGVEFYANRQIPVYTKLSSKPLTLPLYMLVWENEWSGIEKNQGLKLQFVSESVDRQEFKRGHLHLVVVSEPLLPSHSTESRG